MKTVKASAIGFLTVGLLLVSSTTLAAASFQEGANYVPVSPPQPTTVQPGQIEVIEFFWYGCPHCFAVEPYVDAWLKHKPANVVFKLIPAAWTGGEHMDIDAKAFYTAQALGLEPKIHDPLFNAIHVQNQFALVSSQDALQKFFAKYGVNKQQFDSTWDSFGVQLKMNQALQTLTHYGIQGVPAFVVNGKWMTGAGYGQMMPKDIVNCVEFLVQKEEAALKK
ncbi:MAG: thiol:disulfide interchange protein DsbA/DsbL [Gammaproteobacteria bacterium]